MTTQRAIISNVSYWKTLATSCNFTQLVDRLERELRIKRGLAITYAAKMAPRETYNAFASGQWRNE
ncbi:MAG: hypothetical protein QOH39_1129 [Verrucomicrobiota bacterium]|jgi:hypothetical protein